MTATAERADLVTAKGEGNPWAGARAWFLVLLAAALASIPLHLRYGRRQWFFLDEWSFLVNRNLATPDTLFEPHNGHWVTVPAIVYRVLYQVWGITTYRPYQLAAITMHLAVVLLCWAVMRRLGVRPWIATLASASLILFGTGWGNILFGFQITLTGSVACGFAHLLLADHDGDVDRRDFLGLGFGLIGLMCSGVGVAMIAAVGVAAFVRRGWRVSLLHVGVPALAYGAWYVLFPSDSDDPARDYSFNLDTFRFVGRLGWAVFDGLGQYGVVGACLVTLACVALGWSIVHASRAKDLRRAAMPLGLTGGFLAFAFTTAIARVGIGGVASAASGRYVYVAAALLLPLVALGVELLARRQIALALGALVLLAVGVPGNVDLLAHPSLFTGQRDFIAMAAFSPLLDQLPARMRLRLTDFAPELAPTAGWLRSARDAGRVRRPSNPTAPAILTTDLQLAVRPARPPESSAVECAPAEGVRRITVDRGDRIEFSGAIGVRAVERGVQSTVMPVDAPTGGRLDVVAGPLELEIAGLRGQQPRLC
jgi:hypothetical protein